MGLILILTFIKMGTHGYSWHKFQPGLSHNLQGFVLLSKVHSKVQKVYNDAHIVHKALRYKYNGEKLYALKKVLYMQKSC